MFKIVIFLLFLGLFFSAPAHAKIEKSAMVCEKEICLYWWPALAPLPGWHQDLNASHEFRVNMLAPDNVPAAKITAVMYANAIYKPRDPSDKILTDFIAGDQENFTAEGISVKPTNDIVTADNQHLKSFTFTPTKGGRWERVSYGEEGDFWLNFTISAVNAAELDKAMPAYEHMIEAYKAASP